MDITFEFVRSLKLSAICLLLFITSCASPDMTPSPNSLHYLALGDSYTIGESVRENERWPAQLVAALRERGLSIADADIIARTGWTTADLQRAIAQQYNGQTYDLVSLLIGVNDQFQGLSIEAYPARFKELLNFAITAAGGDPTHVIVVSIPDWGATPFAEGQDRAAIGAEIDAFNAVNREESVAAGVQYFDITPISRQAASDPGLVAGDGLHPSGEMYTRWVELILPNVYALLAPTD
jgi:lysophospholipase L1-like esterase